MNTVMVQTLVLVAAMLMAVVVEIYCGYARKLFHWLTPNRQSILRRRGERRRAARSVTMPQGTYYAAKCPELHVIKDADRLRVCLGSYVYEVVDAPDLPGFGLGLWCPSNERKVGTISFEPLSGVNRTRLSLAVFNGVTLSTVLQKSE